ncbi:hypothetical protein GH741_10925 [Aquibacillus halophilus]|uniref:Uncharacterized protein n=1 Tax=Aquibacillus halophilus TaxID=930132 RepID=A0A6A8DBX3_9BACI|nr:hypothetical protein [Aquibacillus halophilus]MRH43193.1 hypothetical protein [Aquibacillus halophilus]
MSFEMPPKCETCRLVGTTKDEDQICVTVLHYEEGFVYFRLSETRDQRKDIEEYIIDLLPKILSGVYHVELIDMGEEIY